MIVIKKIFQDLLTFFFPKNCITPRVLSSQYVIICAIFGAVNIFNFCFFCGRELNSAKSTFFLLSTFLEYLLAGV